MLFERERDDLLETLADMRAERILDTTGGALSVRCDENLVLVTPTGAPPRRWRVRPEDLVVINTKGDIVERGRYAPIAAYTMHLALYETLPTCNAVLHSHTSAILAFASAGVTMPSNTNATDKFGEVPTVFCHDLPIKREYLRAPWPLHPNSHAHHRPDVAAVNDVISAAVDRRFAPRDAELHDHGLAFLMYRHGVVTMGKDLTQAFDCLAKVHTNAEITLLTRPETVRVAAPAPAESQLLEAYFLDPVA